MPRRCQDRCVGRSVKSYPLEFAVFRVVAQETERRSDRRQNCSAAQERLSGQSACFFRIAFAHAQDRTIGLAPRCRILPGHAFVKRDRSREPSSVAIGHPTVERSYRGAFRVRSCRDKIRGHVITSRQRDIAPNWPGHFMCAPADIGPKRPIGPRRSNIGNADKVNRSRNLAEFSTGGKAFSRGQTTIVRFGSWMVRQVHRSLVSAA